MELPISLRSIPPMDTLPLWGSQNLHAREATVLFPLPLGPTRAVTVPGLIVRWSESTAGRSDSG